LDVQVATFMRGPAGPLRLTPRDGGRPRPAIEIARDDYGDNGFAAFTFDPPWEPAPGATAELSGVPGEHSAPWLGKADEICLRTFHEPPVPPDSLDRASALTARPGPGSARGVRWAAAVAPVAARRAVYLWRSLGALEGT